MRPLRIFFLPVLLILFVVSCQHRNRTALPVQGSDRTVEILQTPQGFTLLRHGKPYFIKGAGGYEHFDQLKKRGGNSIRVWDTNDAERVLDEAQQLDLSVMLGLWIGRELDGFDYYNPAAVEKQKQSLRRIVERYKDHPALLMWCVGNEWMETATNPEVFTAVNDIARMIHEVDPNHPVTTALVLTNTTRRFKILTQRCPDIDILALNSYASLPRLEKMVDESGWAGPYLVSEFGPLGYWESSSAAWGAPTEPTSSQKAEFVKGNYQRYIARNNGKCLGSYVFLWGQKQEKTPTWYSMFDEQGNATALVDAMQEVWSSQQPDNRAPAVSQLIIDHQYGAVNSFRDPKVLHTASLQVTDPDGDSLTYRWEILPEVEEDTDIALYKERKPDPIPGLVHADKGCEISFRLPSKPGPYRLFVYVYDGKNHVATANIPFRAEAVLQ